MNTIVGSIQSNRTEVVDQLSDAIKKAKNLEVLMFKSLILLDFLSFGHKSCRISFLFFEIWTFVRPQLTCTDHTGAYMWDALWIVLPLIYNSSRFLLALEIISLSVWSNYRFNCWACSLPRVSVISTNTRGMKRRVSQRAGYWVTCQQTVTRV